MLTGLCQDGSFDLVRTATKPPQYVAWASVDPQSIKASYDNGVLTVVLPKSEKAKPRRIEVSGGSKSRQLGEISRSEGNQQQGA